MRSRSRGRTGDEAPSETGYGGEVWEVKQDEDAGLYC
jgi:hypothetical protein